MKTIKFKLTEIYTNDDTRHGPLKQSHTGDDTRINSCFFALGGIVVMNNKQKHIVNLYLQEGYKLQPPLAEVPKALRLTNSKASHPEVFINQEGLSFYRRKSQ
jgi:hypothetical protein